MEFDQRIRNVTRRKILGFMGMQPDPIPQAQTFEALSVISRSLLAVMMATSAVLDQLAPLSISLSQRCVLQGHEESELDRRIKVIQRAYRTARDRRNLKKHCTCHVSRSSFSLVCLMHPCSAVVLQLYSPRMKAFRLKNETLAEIVHLIMKHGKGLTTLMKVLCPIWFGSARSVIEVAVVMLTSDCVNPPRATTRH